MLTYLQVHIIYTIPPTIVLFFILRPFINAFERFKLATLVALAVTYTTPWDNYIVYHKAWWYRQDAVLATIGYVPIEEYAFFVIQTLMTTLWTMLCMRWSLSSLHLKHENHTQFYTVRYSVMSLVSGLIVWGWRNAIPATKTFYMGSICWWALLIVLGLWYGAGNYAFRRRFAVALSVLVPTIYLCSVDLVALRAGVWHINEATSFEYYFFNDLPIEEITFFFITNLIVVLGSCAFDKSQAVVDTYYTHLFPYGLKTSDANTGFWEYICTSMIGFTTSEIDLPVETIVDLETSIKVLDEASKSFSFAANVFSNDVKHDLTLLYAFCRVTDDMIDRETEVAGCKKQLNMIQTFLDQLFGDRVSVSYFDWSVKQKSTAESADSVDWAYFQKHLTVEQLASFRGISRIAHYLPQQPFYELVEGYKWDIDGRLVKHEDDLKLYSSYVASSVATLCTFIVCKRSNYWPDNFGKKCEAMIEHARNMGMVLQMVNISRDIITDSETLGRCYVPINFFQGDENILQYLVKERRPDKIDNSLLKAYAERILNVADDLAQKAIVGVHSLPVDNQRGILTALEIYQGIGKAIRSNSSYERRTRLGKVEKAFIFFKCMYICKL